jgi:hypothetical protein
LPRRNRAALYGVEGKLFALARADQQQTASADLAGVVDVDHVPLLAVHLVRAEQLADRPARALV